MGRDQDSGDQLGGEGRQTKRQAAKVQAAKARSGSRRFGAWLRCGLAAALMAAMALPAAARTFVVGGKAYTEQYVLAEITKQMLQKAGFDAQTRVGYATDTIRLAQLSGEIDISWDYTWTGYAFHLGFTEPRPADQVLEIVREFDAENGLIWLARSSVNNSFALAVNLDFAAEACIHSLTELAQGIRNGLAVRLASDQECHKREDCLLRAQRVYDFQIAPSRIEVMNVADTYEALRERRADLAVVYSTDGKIPAYDLELLEDPELVFAEDYVTPVIRADSLDEAPELRQVLERIGRALDTQTMQDLNYRIDVVGQPVEQVARYFIASKGL